MVGVDYFILLILFFNDMFAWDGVQTRFGVIAAFKGRCQQK